MTHKFKPALLGIPNLTLIIIIATAIVNGLDLYLRNGSPSFWFGMLFTPDWWNVFLFPFRITDSWFSLILYLYVFYLFGQQLEQSVGDFKYTLYIFTGYIFVLVGTIFYPMSANFVYLSVFLAIAHLAPDMQILLFFVLPIKMRWIALITVAFVLYGPISLLFRQGAILPLLGPLLGFANYLLFFGIPHLLRNRGTARGRNFKRQMKTAPTVHKCAICGLTEADDPTMDFRYCVDCDDLEYCTNHLHNHRHIKAREN
ncbi:MAG: hypothetical protein H3C43_06935 [Leptonema sp. (in: Bacteria)]|nr:hypothetical protein [Leptonema sp. (in: bacteria)]